MAMSRYCIAEHVSSWELLAIVKPYELTQEKLLVKRATVGYLDTLNSQTSSRIIASMIVFCNAVALGVFVRLLAIAA